MQKYTVTSKGKKTLFCTYYNAVNSINNTQHTIQKLSRRDDWNQVLAKKDLHLMKQQQLDCLPTIIEALQQEGKFFVVFGQGLGFNLDDLRKKRLQLDQIVSIGIKMLDSIQKFNKEGVEFYDIRPQFFFWNSPNIKVAYTPTRQQTFLKSLGGELSDIRYNSPQTVLQGELDQYSSVFSTGLILSGLILGQTIIQAKNKLDYIYTIAQIFPKDKIKTSESLQPRLLKKCSADLTNIILSMMNPQRQKRMSLQNSLNRLMTVDLSINQSPSSELKTKQQVSHNTSKISHNSSKISHSYNPSNGSEYQMSRQYSNILQQIKQTPTNFNFSFPVENPPLNNQVQKLKIVTLLKKQQNIADDVKIATLITSKTKTKSEQLQDMNQLNDFDIPQQTAQPQFTVFAQPDKNQDSFNIPGLSQDDDNGLFQVI